MSQLEKNLYKRVTVSQPTKVAAEKTNKGTEKTAEQSKVNAAQEDMKTVSAVYSLGFLDFILLLGLMMVIWFLMPQSKICFNGLSENHD